MHLGAIRDPSVCRHRFRPAYWASLSGLQVDWIDRAHNQRASVQQFIADIYAKQYQASVPYFCDELIACRNTDGQWVAAVGLTPLADRSAYLEQYLDQPVEQMIAVVHGKDAHARRIRSINRRDGVELGNLACVGPGMARAIILLMTCYLYRQQYRWAVFTATPMLLNVFKRVHLNLIEIAAARPEKIDGATQLWGHYYEHQPRVMFGDVQVAYEQTQ